MAGPGRSSPFRPFHSQLSATLALVFPRGSDCPDHGASDTDIISSLVEFIVARDELVCRPGFVLAIAAANSCSGRPGFSGANLDFLIYVCSPVGTGQPASIEFGLQSDSGARGILCSAALGFFDSLGAATGQRL